MDTFLQDEVEKEKKNRNEWARMNAIQKSGVIGSFVLLFAALFVREAQQPYVDVAALTSLFLGWVAGSLWKVRHALHFWWSSLIAFLGHLFLLPTYLRVIRYFQLNRHPGREVAMVEVGMVAVETILSVVVLKRTAVMMHARTRRSSKPDY